MASVSSIQLKTLGLLIAILIPFLAAAQEIEASKAKAAFKAAIKFLDEHPERRADYLKPGFNLPEIDDEVLIQFLQSNGEPSPTRLNTVKNSLLDLGTSLLWMKDRKNMTGLYRIVYPKVPKDFRNGLKKPKELKTLPLPMVKKALLKLFKRVDLNFIGIIDLLRPGILTGTLINPIGICSAEIGYGVAGSESELSERCELADYDPDGIFTNFDFPLKDNLTCIKAQGARGTCVAHAIAATTESLALIDGDPAENLSEQHLYYRGETEGDVQVSLGDMQVYGLYTDIVLDALNQGNWGIFYENGWNYNQSLGMGSLTISAQGTVNYPNSCDGNYTGGPCDVYSWQTGALVVLPGVPQPDPPPVIPPPAVHTIISDSSLIMDGGGVISELSLQIAVLLLAGDVPMIISMAVTDAFKNTTDGYVLDTANDPVAGGHAMELIGFIPNSELSANITAATDEGYFIVKNSWGITSGDCGFYYLDYAYVKDHAYYISVIDIS